jgi:hypothetical protein
MIAFGRLCITSETMPCWKSDIVHAACDTVVNSTNTETRNGFARSRTSGRLT